MHEHASPRQGVESLIASDDLEGLLRLAATLHGHRCPFLALGVKAGHYALRHLGLEHPGQGDVAAILEGRNCFADGIQAVTGCTFGNDGLIFKDWGKSAVTVVRRRDGAALRLAVRADFRERMFARYPAAGPLFEKVVVQRQGTAEDLHRFQHLWEGVARRELTEVPLEEQFLIQELTIQAPVEPRSFSIEVCSRCGEGVIASRLLLQEGRKLCRGCAGED